MSYYDTGPYFIEEVHTFDVVKRDADGREIERWSFKTETAALLFKQECFDWHWPESSEREQPHE